MLHQDVRSLDASGTHLGAPNDPRLPTMCRYVLPKVSMCSALRCDSCPQLNRNSRASWWGRGRTHGQAVTKASWCKSTRGTPNDDQHALISSTFTISTKPIHRCLPVTLTVCPSLISLFLGRPSLQSPPLSHRSPTTPCPRCHPTTPKRCQCDRP